MSGSLPTNPHNADDIAQSGPATDLEPAQVIAKAYQIAANAAGEKLQEAIENSSGQLEPVATAVIAKAVELIEETGEKSPKA